MLIQIALIALGLALLFLVLSAKGSHGAKASMKIGLLLLVIAMILAVLKPDLTTKLANLVGVGRGTDLLLYVMTAAFLFFVLKQYLKAQIDRDALFRLARSVALLEAQTRYAKQLQEPEHGGSESA